MLTLKFAFLHSWQKKILSRMVMASIFLRTNHSQAVWNSNFPPKTISQSESRRTSRQVLHVTGKILWASVPQKTCQHWKLTTKLDPCGGGKGGLISKLRATLNKYDFWESSKKCFILGAFRSTARNRQVQWSPHPSAGPGETPLTYQIQLLRVL